MEVLKFLGILESQEYPKEWLDKALIVNRENTLEVLCVVLPHDAPRLLMPPGADMLVLHAAPFKHVAPLDTMSVRLVLEEHGGFPGKHNVLPELGVVLHLDEGSREVALGVAALLVSSGFGGVPLTVVYRGCPRWESAIAAEYTVEDSINESDCQHLSTLLWQSVDVDQFLKSLEAQR